MNLYKHTIPALLSLSIIFSVQAESTSSNGIIKIKSNHNAAETISRLENILKKRGMTIFKHIDHTKGAENAGMRLRPTQLLIFGNPKVGTPLMLCAQTIALDLPQKALAYEDEKGQTWLSYNDPAYLARRHQLKNCRPALAKVSKALATFVKAATR